MNLQDTPGGYNPYEVMSALQKCVRRGLEYEAYWWAEELVRNKQDIIAWTRLEVIACEDIGMANPHAILVVQACRQAWERQSGRRGDPEYNILAFAVIYLCRSPKSRSADDLAHLVWLRKDGRDPITRQPGASDPERLEIPSFALDMHTRRGKARLHTESRQSGVPVHQLEVKEFREVSARLNNPRRDLAADGTNWTEEVCKNQGCDVAKALSPVK